MSTSTIKISQLPIVNTIPSNTATIGILASNLINGATETVTLETISQSLYANNVLFVGEYLIFGDGTTQNTTPQSIEQLQSIFDAANLASDQAQTAYNAANAVSGTAQSASDTANSASSNTSAAVNAANIATAVSQSAFDQANTALLSFDTANLALTTANSISGTAQAASNTANSASTSAQLAFNAANTALLSFGTANSAINLASQASATANAAANTAQLAFNTANSAGGGVSLIAVNLQSGTANQILYQVGSNNTNFVVAPTVNNSTLIWNNKTGGFGWNTTANQNSNIANTSNISLLAVNNQGGTANQIPVQSAANTTKFIIAPTVTNTHLVFSTTTGFAWNPVALTSIYLTVINANGVVNTFALTPPAGSNVFYSQVFVNGVYQMTSTGAYSIASNNIIFTENPPQGSVIEVTNYVK